MQFLFFAGQQALPASASSGYMYILIPVAMYVIKKEPIKVTIDFCIYSLKQNVFHICMHVPLKVNSVICMQCHSV